MTYDGNPPRQHLRPVDLDEPPFDPDYETPPPRSTSNQPPQDQVAEQACLGAMLISPDAITQVTSYLDPDDFYRPHHETIFDTIVTLHHAGHPVDMITVGEELARQGNLQNIGGAPYLHTLASEVPLAANAAHYARIVRDKARLRATINAATKIIQISNSPTATNLDNTLGDAVDIITDAAMRYGTRADHATPTTWSPVNLDPVLAGEHLDPPPTMLARTDGTFLLYDGAVHTIAGESESGKTWLTLIAAIQLIAEGDRVVFIDFEDRADRVIGRLLALGATPTQIRDHFAYIRPDRPLDNDGRAQLEPHLIGARLAIVDGVTEAMTTHGFDLNSNADSALFQALIPRWIADHGPAVVLIDHVVKDKEKQDRFALGAQHKLAGIDGVAYLVKMLQPFARGKRGLARVEIAKDRPGHVREHAHGKTIAEFSLDATGSEHVLIAHLMPPGAESGRAGDTFEPTVLMEKISRAVQLTPGLSKKAIEDLVNGKATTKRLALELLVTRGYINAKTESRGRVAHHHIKPYYADPDRDPDNTTDDTDED